MAFLDRMALCFFIVVAIGLILTKVSPMPTPVVMPHNKEIALEESGAAKFWGAVVVVATLALYIVFW